MRKKTKKKRKKEKKKRKKKKRKKKRKKSDEPTKYEKFYKDYNKCLKMGIYEDDANRSKIAKLLRYPTTKSEGKEISFAKYVENMTEKQDQIYYASGDDLEVLKKRPNLQIFNKKGIEVL